MTKVVFTNGCFDLLHRGHLEMLKYARSLGDFLVVGIDSDQKIKKTKGNDRPVYSCEDRIFILQSIRWVDEVYSFDSEFGLERLVKEVRPHIMVVGSDWRGKTIVGSQYAKEVKYFERIEDYSTTQTVKDIGNR